MLQIVDDDKEVREGIGLLINGTENYRCVGAYGKRSRSLRSNPGLEVHVVLMDINMPHTSGIECVVRLKHLQPSLSDYDADLVRRR